MKLADDSRQIFELFFRQLLFDEDFRLPEIYFYAGRFSRLITVSLKIHGITIGKNIFIKPTQISSNNILTKINSELAAHEIAHVLQYRREGFIRFLFTYLRSYRKNLKGKKKWDSISRHQAYLDIPQEVEASEIAAQFVDWIRDDDKKKEKHGTNE